MPVAFGVAGGLKVEVISGGGGNGAGTSDATALNQATEIARLGEIRDRLPLALSAGGALKTDSSATTQPVSGTVSVGNFPATQAISATALPLPTGATTNLTLTEVSDRLGAINEAAAATSTTPSGLNGLIRFLFGLLPSALVSDRFKVESVVKSVSPVTITESALIAAGTTPTQSLEGYYKATYQINATGITNAVLRMEGNVTGTEFANLNESGADKTITANGIYLFKFEGLVSNVRMNLVSVAGTTPSVVAHLKKGN